MTGRSVGRPKKPTALKILEGNPGNRTLPKNEVKPPPIAPKCPTWLHKYAKQEWKALAPKLEELGLLTLVDRTAFAMYCQSYAQWREAEEAIMSKKDKYFITPNGYRQQVPEIGTSKTYTAPLLSALSKFGLSPADRAGLVIPKQDDGGKIKKYLSR